MCARQVVLLTPPKSSHPSLLLSRQHLVHVSPLAATLTKNRGVGAPRGTPSSASVKIAVLCFHALTNCPVFAREEQLLCFHALTNCPFSIPFVLTFMHQMGGVGGSGELSSRKFSTNTLSALDRELSHRCGAARPLQYAAKCAYLAADVAHAQNSCWSRIPSFRRARHESNFFAIHHQRRARVRYGLAGEHQSHSLPVHLPARTHALHDLLSCVAAFRVTDMAVLQSRFVRDLFLAEVVSEPRHALRQPQTAQRRVTHRPATVFPRSIQQNLPKRRKFFALNHELRSRNSTRRTLHDPAGNCADSAVRGRKFGERTDLYAGDFTHYCGGLRPFQRQRAETLRLIRQRHVIHDDEFFQHFHQPFANHGVGHAEQFVRECIRFNLRENVSLRIQKQRNVSLSRGQALDVVRQNSVHVTHAVRPGERKVRAIIFVDQRHALARLPEFRSRVTEGSIHITIPVGMLQCNCSIIGDPATREALVIDPGDEVTRILDLLGRHRLTVKAIVSTHAHIDHVGGLAKLHQYTGAPVLMHRDDLPLYQAMEMQASFLGIHPPELIEIDQLLKEGDSLRWGPFEAQVIHTPGHTPGSVSLYLPHDAGQVTVADAAKKFTVKTEAGKEIDIDDLLRKAADPEGSQEIAASEESEKSPVRPPQLFSGDTLFAGSIGRTDLWGGSMYQIMESLRTKLMHLPDDTVVYPGHGPVTTIGHERHLNPFLLPG